jgi:hypothetical protein
VPIPPIQENTRWFPAGAVTFGVERRVLNDAIRQVHGLLGRTDEDSGVSIHVFNTPDGKEFLRFDCFTREPHYHYILPNHDYQIVVPFDTTANGDMLTWVLDRLPTRLAPMLRESDGTLLADSLDDGVVREVLMSVGNYAASAGPST